MSSSIVVSTIDELVSANRDKEHLTVYVAPNTTQDVATQVNNFCAKNKNLTFGGWYGQSSHGRGKKAGDGKGQGKEQLDLSSLPARLQRIWTMEDDELERFEAWSERHAEIKAEKKLREEETEEAENEQEREEYNYFDENASTEEEDKADEHFNPEDDFVDEKYPLEEKNEKSDSSEEEFEHNCSNEEDEDEEVEGDDEFRSEFGSDYEDEYKYWNQNEDHDDCKDEGHQDDYEDEDQDDYDD